MADQHRQAEAVGGLAGIVARPSAEGKLELEQLRGEYFEAMLDLERQRRRAAELGELMRRREPNARAASKPRGGRAIDLARAMIVAFPGTSPTEALRRFAQDPDAVVRKLEATGFRGEPAVDGIDVTGIVLKDASSKVSGHVKVLLPGNREQTVSVESLLRSISSDLEISRQ